MWYTFLGTVITIVVSLIVSCILGPNKPNEIDPNLLAPFVRKLIGPSNFHEKNLIKNQLRLEPVGIEDNPAYSSTNDLKKI